MAQKKRSEQSQCSGENDKEQLPKNKMYFTIDNPNACKTFMSSKPKEDPKKKRFILKRGNSGGFPIDSNGCAVNSYNDSNMLFTS
jgi:hypothetical protein